MRLKISRSDREIDEERENYCPQTPTESWGGLPEKSDALAYTAPPPHKNGGGASTQDTKIAPSSLNEKVKTINLNFFFLFIYSWF